MFGEMDDKKKELKEKLLENLIDHLMGMPEGSKEEEACESPKMEGLEDKLGMDEKPKAELQIMSVEAKPKEKFKLGDGTEMEDESLEDMMKRKKKEA